MVAKVYVTLKPSILDPQGKTVKSALESLGFKGIQDVRMGKYIELHLAHADTASAKKEVERMCHKLLANPVVETYRIEIARGSGLGVLGKSPQPTARSPEPGARAKRA